MKLKCEQKKILQAVMLAEKISGRNLTLPVLNCILIQVSKNTVTFRSTNLEIGIELNIPCTVLEEGITAVPGSVLVNTLSLLDPNKEITLTTKNNNLVISSETSNTTIKAFPYDDFPTLPTVNTERSFKVKTESYIQGLKSVWYSASLSTVKPELASIYVYAKGDKCYFVATDSFRLAEKIVIIDSLPEFEPFLIPIRNVSEIIRVLENAQEEVEIRLSTNQIAFVFNNIYITSRLIDGSFPDYKQIIPKESTTEIIALKQDVLHTLKKTILFSDNFNQIYFSLNPSKKNFIIESQNADVGETKDSVSATIEGEELDINFNHRYITDCFQSIIADSVVLCFSGLGKPMTIQGVSDNSFLYLVMPMNK